MGLGKTGVAAAGFLAKKGAVILIADEKPVSDLGGSMSILRELGVDFDMVGYDTDTLSGIDLIVPSPGIPPFDKLLAEALKRGIPIISEIELAYEFLKKPVIAITGTNGKTTTTKLIGEILEGCGKKVFVGGNIGNPLISCAGEEREEDYLVAEISSFQLQWIKFFRPSVSVLLNISLDHLDYHKSFEEYRSVKEKIFENQTAEDLAVINAGYPGVCELSKKIAARVEYFGSSSRPEDGIFVDGQVLKYVNSSEEDEEYPVSMVGMMGVHNLENVMAAVLVAKRCGCGREKIIEAVKNFKAVAHRIEFVCERNGVKFYDDSKGTNIDSVCRALESFDGSVVLLMGGRDKGADFTLLDKLVREKVRKLILFGEAAKEINSVIGNLVDTEVTGGLGDAVEIARKESVRGDTVLLSPGCTSFDEFRNYEERGRFFKKLVCPEREKEAV
jgi:UDP-N-acetylmuramoylalanine--D-glutamate ligase